MTIERKVAMGIAANGGAVPIVDYLIVGGGGSSSNARGAWAGGAGGAGGLIYKTSIELDAGTTYNVVVGTYVNSNPNGWGSNGNNSSFNGETAIGGGGAGFKDDRSEAMPNVGGSGGGGVMTDGSNFAVNVGAAGTAGQGHAGGSVTTLNSPRGTAGGGGAGGAGDDHTNTTYGQNAFFDGSDGGAGVNNSITGASVGYAGGGGGGGGGDPGSSGGSATHGGGGGGGAYQAGTAGTMYTGGGGGAAGTTKTGVRGGTGVVIIRSPVEQSAISGTYNQITDGDYYVYRFTASGSITF